MSYQQTKIFKFKKGIDLGSLAAENDKFLNTAFFDTGDVDALIDITSPKRIILGRTGTGKTAILEELKKRNGHIIKIDPEALSLQYLSNSTIIKYLHQLGVHLELFYKLLWKHVFAVELIKCHYKLDDEQSQKKFLSSIFSRFGNNKKKKKAIEYLVEWSKSFWEDTEYRVKEITDSLEKNVKDEVGVDFKYFKAHGSEISSISQEQKTELIHKAQNAVSKIQIIELNELIQIMSSDIFNDPQKKYYILIDDLDKDWVDRTIVYDLIKSLLEVIYDFSSQIKNVKIVIALRDNILERIIRSDTRRGPQREKYESLYLKLYWTEEQLIQLFELRLKQILVGAYESIEPTYKDILPSKSKNSKNDGMRYILERTLLRPRDLIHYFNICIESSVGKTKISLENIRSAELKYSKDRLDSLEDEWKENYFGIGTVFKMFKGFNRSFLINEIEDSFIYQLLQMEMDHPKAAWLRRFLEEFVEQGESSLKTIKFQLISILYQVGFVGIKPSPQIGLKYSFEPSGEIVQEDLTEKTVIHLHPAFHRALSIKPN